jgi:hypothetical protein
MGKHHECKITKLKDQEFFKKDNPHYGRSRRIYKQEFHSL